MPGAMKPEGSLSERDFPDLVQGLHEGGASGSLTLTRAGIGKSVTVEDGRLVFASSSDPDERLGEVLLRRGRISWKAYLEASRAVAPGRRFGAVLVEQGALSPKDLVKAVVDHTSEIIYGAFQWTDGRYRFQAGARSPEAITLNISTPDLILEGIRRINLWSRISRAVGSLESRYERSPGYEPLIAKMSLSDGQLELLSASPGVETVEAICARSILPSIEVCRALWAFRVLGVVKCKDALQAAAPPEDEGFGFVLPS
jgi:Domain of unknown function (DUF4388)